MVDASPKIDQAAWDAMRAELEPYFGGPIPASLAFYHAQSEGITALLAEKRADRAFARAERERIRRAASRETQRLARAADASERTVSWRNPDHYANLLETLANGDPDEPISCAAAARLVGMSSTQIRRDLYYACGTSRPVRTTRGWLMDWVRLRQDKWLAAPKESALPSTRPFRWDTYERGRYRHLSIRYDPSQPDQAALVEQITALLTTMPSSGPAR